MLNQNDFREKYRPMSFKDVVGNSTVVKILKTIIKEGSIPVGMLFFGPPGSGKTTLARLLAKGLLCEDFTEDVCDRCPSCLSFNHKGSSGEFTIYDCTKIDRRTWEDMIYSFRFAFPSRINRHIVILDEFHRMREPLQEQLLKPLETYNNILLMVCLIDLKDIDDALRQRLIKQGTCRPAIAELVPWLQRICDLERIKVKDDSALRQLIEMADQLPRECLSLLQSLSYLKQPLTTSLVREVSAMQRGADEPKCRLTSL